MLRTFRKDGSINVMVESPRGSRVKFKYDPDDEVMTISRPLPEGLEYPYDWGFIPSTKAPDGDPIDAVIVWDASSYPGVVIPCRLIGVLKAEQTNQETKKRERNDRLVVLPVEAPRQAHVNSVFDLTRREREELEEFFLHAVVFQGKHLKLLGWDGPMQAQHLLKESTRKTRKKASRGAGPSRKRRLL